MAQLAAAAFFPVHPNTRRPLFSCASRNWEIGSHTSRKRRPTGGGGSSARNERRLLNTLVAATSVCVRRACLPPRRSQYNRSLSHRFESLSLRRLLRVTASLSSERRPCNAVTICNGFCCFDDGDDGDEAKKAVQLPDIPCRQPSQLAHVRVRSNRVAQSARRPLQSALLRRRLRCGQIELACNLRHGRD